MESFMCCFTRVFNGIGLNLICDGIRKADIKIDVLKADVPQVDVPNADVTNVPKADVTKADVPKADVTNGDVPKADVTNGDVLNIDVSNADVTNADVPKADVKRKRGKKIKAVAEKVGKKVEDLFHGSNPSLESDVNDPFLDLKKSQIAKKFLKEFYTTLMKEENFTSFHMSSTRKYNQSVFSIIQNLKADVKDDPSKLRGLQHIIEEETMTFDEVGVYNSNPQLMKKLIGPDKITAKEYLKNQDNLTEVEYRFLSQLGEYTLEAMIVHVLGILYNPINKRSNVNVASLIDHLDMFVRDYARDSMKREDVVELIPRKGSKKDFTIGVGLVDFLIKGDILFANSPDFNVREAGSTKFKSTSLVCNFDCSMLPIKLNLPMVYPPLKWQYNKPNPKSLMDLSGGYLTNYNKIDIYNRFRLLTSKDKNHFYIDLKNPESVCNILNKLQSQPFEINERLFMFIEENYADLVKVGLLTDRYLSNVNLKSATEKLRVFYFNHPYISNYFPNKELKDLISEFTKLVQRARYEDFVLYLAETYKGFKFYLPAFMDFRGRIYRSGVLHFHERDLAKGLITFTKLNKDTRIQRYDLEIIMSAAAFKFRKFKDYEDAYEFYMRKIQSEVNFDTPYFLKIEKYIHIAEHASHPFQFLAKALTLEFPLKKYSIHDLRTEKGTFIPSSYSDWMSTPVTQDASASAYQIMSYLLLNKDMARLTNLIPSEEEFSIVDLYLSLKKDLESFLKERLDFQKYQIVIYHLDRKLMKTLFMPLIYGKTVMTMTSDIRAVYGELLTYSDSNMLAKLCYEFWVYKYPDIINLMKLINLIGWICSFLGREVIYSVDYFTTVQNYKRSKKAEIVVYDSLQKKKRRKVTLRVPTQDPDKRKTAVSTCVNFIHQKDAFIAMRLIEHLRVEKNPAPIYTVHDNFITIPHYAEKLPKMYIKVFVNLGHPLHIINEFLSLNLKNLSMLSYDDRVLKKDMYRKHRDVSEPLRSDYLRDKLRGLEPSGLTSKEKSLFETKIEEVIS